MSLMIILIIKSRIIEKYVNNDENDNNKLKLIMK